MYPEYQVFSPAYNQILPAFGLPRSMDGIVCRDEAVAKVQTTVFSNTLQGALYIKSQDYGRALITGALLSIYKFYLYIRWRQSPGLWAGLDHRRILFKC